MGGVPLSMMDLSYLCAQYGLGRLQRAEELSPGTSARVWRLETEGSVYLLRTLRDREQGELERDICAHLRGRGFAAVPHIPVPLVQREGRWYQVQEHISGTMPDPARPGVAGKMGRTVRGLMEALSDFPGGPVIHGDLGPWNMVEREGDLWIIDFGSARPGDPWFDPAAALGGVINHSPEELRLSACRDFMTGLGGDAACLRRQLRLWAEEGAARWKGAPMEQKFYNALNWAEEHWHELQTDTHDR